MSDILVIRMQHRDTDCFLCGRPASPDHGVPMFEGDLVSNDWKYDWVGVPACIPCFDLHASGKLPVLKNPKLLVDW